MAFTLDDIMGQLGSLFSGGNYQGNGATTFAAPAAPTPSVVGNTVDFSANKLPNVAGAAAGAGSGFGFGLNLGTAGLALNGLSSLNNLLQGNKALNLAQDQFKFTKGVTNTNLNNSIQAYNTNLEDRLRSRGVAEGTDSSAVAAELERKRLTR